MYRPLDLLEPTLYLAITPTIDLTMSDRFRVCICCGRDAAPARVVRLRNYCRWCSSGKCARCRRRLLAERLRLDPTSNLVGRPRGPQMPCGWGCGAKLTEHQMRCHFTDCPNRPSMPRSGRLTQPADVETLHSDRHSGGPRPKRGRSSPPPQKCTTNLRTAPGRPPGRRMACGWACGAQLTATQMRRHFNTCPRRPKVRCR
jgi:hypothetical protein